MNTFWDAITGFVDALTAVGWSWLGLALACHFLRLLCRAPAWRNIIRASYPDARVPFWSVYGAYVAGVGVNAVIPARGGDLLRLFLVHRRVEGAKYATLGTTLLPETLFDFFVAGALVAWALTQGFLPGLDVLPDLPTVDWSWPARHPNITMILAGALVSAAIAAYYLAEARIERFRQRVAQGFAILRDRRAYLRKVVTWQATSWIFRGASVYFFLHAFHMPATLRNTLVVLVVQSLATLLPFTPGGVGTVQGLLVYIFRDAVEASVVLSFSIGMHVATVLLNVVVGFTAIFLMLHTLRWRKVVKQPEERLAEQ